MKKKPVFKALLQRDGCEVRFTVLRQDARLMKRGHFIFKSSIGVEIISEQCPELFKESIFIRGFMRDKDKITSIYCFDDIAESKVYYDRYVRALKELITFLKKGKGVDRNGNIISETEEKVIEG